MMSSPIARDRPGHAAEHAVEILVLSLDDALIAGIESSLEGAWRVHHARSMALAIDVLTERGAGVLITDEALEHAAFQKLTRQLREQFPHLIVIGVGEREGAAALIEMVNSGQIYRFLLKPLSPGQVRLRVQAAAHQHVTLREGGGKMPAMVMPVESARPVAETAEPMAVDAEPAAAVTLRFWRKPLVIGGVVAAVVAVIVVLIWMAAQRTGAPAAPAKRIAPAVESVDEPAESTGAATDGSLSQIEILLDAASAALQEQRFVEPVEDNALDYYLAALKIEPGNPEAAAGLDTVAGVLLGQAQAALGEDRAEDALAAYGIVKEIRPAHPDLPLVDAAFGDHGRLLIARMNLAVAADDSVRAREHLDLAARFLAEDSEEIAEARVLLAERLSQFAVNERLTLANARMDANSLTVPENDSAKFHLLALDAEYPEDPAVDAGLARLAGIMFDRTDSALLEENYEAAERWLTEVEALGVEAEALDERRAALAVAQTEPEAALAEDAAVAAAGEPAEGAGAEAGAEETGPAPVAAGNAATEPEWVASTSDVAAAPLAGAGAQLDVEPVAVSELEILRMVEPEYPRRAWVRDIEGWVELEFTVTETGLTRAIEVIDAQSRGWFDRAAVDALEQWRFEPEQHDGQPIERRAKVRLQFTRD